MPTYRFIVHGEGIRTERGLIGFFTTRSTKAENEQLARLQALASVDAEWRTGDSSQLSPGLPPSLAIVKGWAIKGRDRGPNAGHCFYSDLESMENALQIEEEAVDAPTS